MARFFALLVLVLVAASPAQARKRDHDKLPDRWERKHHLNLARNDAKRDRDHDGLSNYREYRAHTNPRKKDTDRDRVRDRAELKAGLKPRDRDSDDDGIKDGRENPGKITKVSATSITLKLAVGGRLTARLACDSGPAAGDPEETTDPAEDAEDPADGADDAAIDEDGTDPAEAETAQDEPDEPDEPDAEDELSDEEFDRIFDEEFTAGDDGCDTSALKAGRWVREATVDRSGPTPVITAIQLAKKHR